ncbi:hypothetical protein [Rhodopirellula sallentina]|nr:hypothetical protein [Rhodopirellula sallentina]
MLNHDGDHQKQPGERETPSSRVPVAALLSVLSLDAVLVAAAWQQLLMRSFCQRSASWPEMIALSTTVWLIYVADRLLDASRLDRSRPHTLRHAFYLRHRRLFFAAWVAVLLADTFVVVRFLSPEVLRSGLVLAAAVLVYGAGVHFPSSLVERNLATDRNPATRRKFASKGFRRERRTIPKEFRVGVLFALGVSLTAWADRVFVAETVGDGATLLSLGAATVGMAILFCVNCVLVARYERYLDEAQSFASIATRSENGVTRLMNRSLGVFAFVIALPIAALLGVPTPVGAAILIAAMGLAVIAIAAGDHETRRSSVNRNQGAMLANTIFDVRGVWVDAVLWTPPAVILCCV